MIQEQKKIDIIKSHDFKETYFGISQGNEAHIFGILRNNLYSDKQLAVIREYVTNANDSHIQAGINAPIEITLPSLIDSNFRVRDFGSGLSEEDVSNIFGKYGASTKRGTNEQVGFMGIGSKSAFCYTDSFSVVSRNNGEKCVYCCYIDESQLGKIAQISREPLSSDDRPGLEIIVPVKSNDIHIFTSKLYSFCKYFYPSPKINGKIYAPNIAESYVSITSKYICPKDYTKTVIMGNIPYTVNIASLNGFTPQQIQFYSHPNICYFPLGSLDIAASRETLQFTPRTLDAMKKFANDEIEVLRKRLSDNFNKCKTYYEAVVYWNDLQQNSNLHSLARSLGIVESFWNSRAINSYAPAKDFKAKVREVNHIRSGIILKSVTFLYLSSSTQYFINDSKKFSSKAIEQNVKSTSLAFVLDFDSAEDQAAFIKEFKGLNVRLISDLKTVKEEKEIDTKSKQKILQFNLNKHLSRDRWEEVELDYEEGGIYVPIWHYGADIKNKYVEGTYDPAKMEYLIKLLNDSKIVKIDKLYGVKRAYVPKLNSKWVSLSSLFEKYLDSISNQTVLELATKKQWNEIKRRDNTLSLLSLMSNAKFNIETVKDPIVKEFYELIKVNSMVEKVYHAALESIFADLSLDVTQFAKAKKVDVNIEKVTSDFHSKYNVLKHLGISYWQNDILASVLQEYIQVLEHKEELSREFNNLLNSKDITLKNGCYSICTPSKVS